MNLLGVVAAALALVPAPKEQVWREGTCAFAEAVWTAPAATRDYADFARRMAVHRKRLIAAGVNCAPLE